MHKTNERKLRFDSKQNQQVYPEFGKSLPEIYRVDEIKSSYSVVVNK